VQPQPLKGDETTRHIITVLSPQQAVEPFGKSADHRRRKHMRQLDEGIMTEGFTLGSIKSVGGCEFHPQLLIVGGVHVGKAGPSTSAIGASSFSARVTYQSHQS
jgi:hypothetical protein